MQNMTYKRLLLLIGNIILIVYSCCFFVFRIIDVLRFGVPSSGILRVVLYFIEDCIFIVVGLISIKKDNALPIILVLIIDNFYKVIRIVLLGYFSATDYLPYILPYIISEVLLFLSYYVKEEKENFVGEKQQSTLESNNETMPATKSVIIEEGKNIIKTKILETKERETAASKKKGRWLSALASGFSAGFGGDRKEIILAGHAQDARNAKNAKYETVVTFLVIYDDNSRKTVDVIKGDENYNQLIMYLE